LKQAPDFVKQAALRGELAGGFPGAALKADIRGFTSRFESLWGMGSDGAETVAREVSGTLSQVVKVCADHGGCPVSFAGDAVTTVFPGGEKDARAAAEKLPLLGSGATLPIRASVGVGQICWDVIPRDSWAFFSFQGPALSLAAGDFRAIYGRPLSGLPAPAPVNIDGFLPPDLFEDGAVNQFRQVSSIFLSLENRSGSSCPREFQEMVLDAAEEFGGFVSGLEAGSEGHRILVVFGAPKTREDDPQRADAFIRKVFSKAPGRVRAGAATGPVFSGTLATPLLEAYTVLGSSVNMAARLHDAAGWNSVCCDPLFNDSSGMGVRQCREVNLKGFSGPVDSLVLTPWKRRMENRGAVPPLIERDRLLERVRGALSAPGASVLLLGETGMGKTRLSEEIHARFGTGFLMNLRCRSLTAEGSDVFSDWFRGWLGEKGLQDGLPAFKEKLYGFVDALEETSDPEAEQVADELLRAESLLAAMVGFGWDDSLYQGLDPQGRFNNTVSVTAAFIRGHGLLGRVLVTVDDFQWIDPDSMRLFSAVLKELRGDRPPILLLARPDAGETACDLGMDPEVMELAPLSREGSLRFLQWSLGRHPSDALLDWFHGRTEGIPFFMEHYAGMLESADAPPDEDGFPVSLHALLVARLDRLGPDLRRAALAAGLLGREFHGEILECLCPDVDCPGLLERGVRERVWVRTPDGGYSFVHVLLREAACRLQLHSERGRLHARAAEEMERLWKDSPEKAGLIASQKEQAGLSEEAAEWFMKAGGFSLSRRMNTSCQIQLQKVLDLSHSGGLRMSALRLLYDLHVSSGDMGKALDIIEQAAGEPGGGPGHNSRIRLMRANLAINSGRPGEASEHLEGLEEEYPVLRPEVLHLRGRILMLQGRSAEAREALQKVYMEFREGSPENRLLAYKALGNACGCTLRLQDGIDQAEAGLLEVLDYARSTGNLLMETLSVGNLALAYKYLPGRLEDAMRMTRNHIELARKTGSRLVELQALGNLGSLMERNSPSLEAMQLLEKAVELARKYGGKDSLTIALANLANARHRAGRNREALDLFEEVLEICRDEELGLHRTDYSLEMSNILMDMGRLEEAESVIQEVEQRGFSRDYLPFLSGCRGRLMILTGRASEAEALLRDTLGETHDDWERFDLLRCLHQATGDPGILDECIRVGESLQKSAPHWDTARILDELRAIVAGGPGGDR
jgi:class 3 adenylate cyclase/tetratricopeptide (TPR) repeat protein